MFQTLDEQIGKVEAGRHTTTERLVRLASIIGISVVLFGGLYLAIVALE